MEMLKAWNFEGLHFKLVSHTTIIKPVWYSYLELVLHFARHNSKWSETLMSRMLLCSFASFSTIISSCLWINKTHTIYMTYLQIKSWYYSKKKSQGVKNIFPYIGWMHATGNAMFIYATAARCIMTFFTRISVGNFFKYFTTSRSLNFFSLTNISY